MGDSLSQRFFFVGDWVSIGIIVCVCVGIGGGFLHFQADHGEAVLSIESAARDEAADSIVLGTVLEQHLAFPLSEAFL
jgi:hypothetical protein